MDREAWWATVHGAAKSHIQLSNSHLHIHMLVHPNHSNHMEHSKKKTHGGYQCGLEIVSIYRALCTLKYPEILFDRDQGWF